VKVEKILWRLNCLVYTGAVVVRWKHPSKAPRSQQVKEADVTTLHKIIGWLESEIRWRRNGQKATAGQRKNMRRLMLERCSWKRLLRGLPCNPTPS